MEEPSAEGLLVAGGATEVEGAASGSQGRSIRDGEGEAATPRKNLSVSSSLPRRNLRKEFRTPQVIKISTQVENSPLQLGQNSHAHELIKREGESDSTSARTGMRFPKPTRAKKSSKPVENSQLQPDEPLEFPPVQDSHAHVIMERDTDSTASSPQPPLPIGKDPSSRPEMRFPKPTGVRNGADNHGIPANDEHLPSKNTSPKTSPMKVQKPVKIKRRSSRTSSDVWEYFTQEDTEAGSVAICVFCKQVYQCDRGFHGTSTLRGHLLYRCSSCPFTDHDKRRKLSLQDHRFSAEKCRRALAKMIIMDEYPFSAVEGEGFREYSKMLQPDFEPPSRYTVARDCLNLYLEEKMKLKEALRDQRVCLTTDTWTSIQNQNYMSLTAHWINNQWELERKVLNFCFVPDHAGDTLGRMIEECLLEWDIGQVFTLTVDNATSNNTAIDYLKTATEHWPSTICKNQFLHVRCCCHIVNLVVKKGWEGSNPSVAKIRTALLFVKSSPGRLRLFKKCVKKEKIGERGLFSLDVDTRWNSTYLMLEDTVPFEKAFKRLGEECKYFTPYFSRVGGPPTADDWLEARKLISVFKLFYNVTVRFSRQLNVTSTAFFHDFLLMQNKITQLIRGKKEEPGLASMAENMKLKFEKYWDNNDILNPLLFIAVILDPRYKVKFLEYGFSIIYDREKAKTFTKKVEDSLTRLFEWYAEAELAPSNSEVSHVPLEIDLEDCAENPRKLWASSFLEHLQVIESKAANTELAIYLAEVCEKDTDDFSILTWWRRRQMKYPTLSKVAKDVLAVPVSTIASEASFSTGRRVINPQRSSLSPKMIEALICGQSWLRSTPNKIDLRQTIADLHKYEELAQELRGLEFGEA